MGRHNIYLVDTKTESNVQHHIESKLRQNEPQEARTASCPYSKDEEECDDTLYHIVDGISVIYYYGARSHNITQQIILMYLYRFAKKILYY